MSIELCDVTGDDAATLLLQKLIEPTLPLQVGGRSIDHILAVIHAGNGETVIRYIDPSQDRGVFQFVPTLDPFSETATSPDGQPICLDCKDR